MFTTRDVWMVIQKATLKITEDDKGVEHRSAQVALVLDPFPMPLAHELGEDVATHFFTEDGAVRQEVSSVSLDPRVPVQRMSVTSAVGHPGTEIRDVEIRGLSVAKQEDDKSGRVWFKATFNILFGLESKLNQEWLVRCFGLGMNFSFYAEQLSMLDDASAAAKRLGDLGGGTLTDADGNAIMKIEDTSRANGEARA